MLKSYIVLFFLLTVLGCASSDKTSVLINDVNTEQAATYGLEIYKNFIAYDKTTELTQLETQTANALSQYSCDGVQYITFSVVRESDGFKSIYHIANTPIEKGVQFGRHIRVDYKLNTDDLINLSKSTNGCILISTEDVPEGSEVAGVFITHVLSETPSEFHVFLSYLHNKTIFVGTSSGTWKVNENSIELMSL